MRRPDAERTYTLTAQCGLRQRFKENHAAIRTLPDFDSCRSTVLQNMTSVGDEDSPLR